MKYANYHFRARGVNNLGDQMQILAIEALYEGMGIDLKDVVYIDTNDLATYIGEYVVLPVTMPLVDYRSGGLAGRFSPYIIPVFLGLTMVKDTLSVDEVAYLRRWEPVGCRDERTMETLRRCGIEAYLHGCITVTLPRRPTLGKHFEKIFLVDPCESLMPFIPEDYTGRVVRRSHLHDGAIGDPKELMRTYYREYRDEAALIVTSLLHCAVPCLAASIPVVLAKETISYRFGWLEKLLPIYDRYHFAEIDWNPGPLDLEAHKLRVIELTRARLREAFERRENVYTLSEFYEARPKKVYVNDACDSLKKFIDETWTERDGVYRYSVWGLTQIAEFMVAYIRKNFPNARLEHVYDTFRCEIFEGMVSEAPDGIRDHLEEYVLVTTNGAVPAAEKLFREIGKPERTYAYVKVIY